MSTTPVERVVSALERHGCYPVQAGPDSWAARCPAHDDNNPSLSVGTGDEDRALLHCHRGCPTDDIITTIGLSTADLFPASDQASTPERPHQNGRRRNGLGKVVATYPYTDEDGHLLYQVLRYEPKTFRQRRPDGNGGWVWSLKGCRRVLYRLPDVRDAIYHDRLVWVTEGEKDADALTRAGETATCSPQGAGKWDKVLDAADQLAGATVMIWVDDDTPGHDHGRQVARSIDGHAHGWIVVRSRHAKDAADHIGQGRTLTLGTDLEELAASDGNRTWLDGTPPEPDTPTTGDDPGPTEPPPDEPPPSDEVLELTTWEPHDLSPLLNGHTEQELPTIGRIGDEPGAIGLFYLGRINGLFGESGGGKSWVAVAVAAQELHAGHGAMVIDFEDDAAGWIARFRALGIPDDTIAQHFIYIHPDLPLRGETFELLAEIIEARDVRLVVLDSLGEVMSLEGVKDEDGPVTAFMQRFPRWLAALGPAIVPIDHVPKSKDAPLDYAIGSQRKRGAVTGALYRVDQFHKMAQGRTGAVKLTVAKDRRGTRMKGSVAAEITFDATTEGRMDATFDVPEAAATEDGKFRPTTLMERVSRYLEDNTGPHTQGAVLGAVTGNRDGKRSALARLVEEGFVSLEEEGQTHKYSFLRRFET